MLVSKATDGTQSGSLSLFPSISSTGRLVTFTSFASDLVPGDTTIPADVYRHDRDTDGDAIFDEPGFISTIRVSMSTAGIAGDDHSFWSTISDDGNRIAFTSIATNLAAADTNGVADVFVRDVTAVTTRVSVDSTAAQANGPTVCLASVATATSSPSSPTLPTWWHSTPMAPQTSSFVT